MHSLLTVLPPLKRTQKQVRFAPVIEPTVRHHVRTMSAPVLPSQSNRLSLDLLLDAIDLDQQMNEQFKDQVARRSIGISKPSQFKSTLRRRSKSAPGVLQRPTRVSCTRWWALGMPQDKLLTESGAEQVAQEIVQKHIESALKRP
ncbi:hypothetical protein BDF14DRAFT_1886346 [Spinellus fusiger]|nr:hypothetical protein BDF14DRAFT_1886346 [Spinellus fusiger]